MIEIDNIQSGTFNFTGTDQTQTITAVTLGKAMLCVSYSCLTDQPGTGCVAINLDTTTTIRFRRDSSGNTVTVKWYVIEFTAASDIDVQHGVISTPTELNNDVTITSVGSLSEAFSFAMGCQNAGSNFGIDDTSESSLPNVTTVRAYIASGQGPPDLIAWQVVNSPDINVQTVSTTGTSSTNLNNSITAIVDAQTSVFSSGTAVGTSNIGANAAFRHWLTTTTNLNSQRDSGAAQHRFFVYVVEWPSNVSVQKFRETSATTGATVNFTLTAVDTAKTFPVTIASLDALGKQAGDGGNDIQEFQCSLEITSTTNLAVVRGDNTNNLYRHVQTIEISASRVVDLTPAMQASYMG